MGVSGLGWRPGPHDRALVSGRAAHLPGRGRPGQPARVPPTRHLPHWTVARPGMTDPNGTLDAERVRGLFLELSDRLAACGVTAQLFVVGGAAMALAYEPGRLTRDVDGVFVPAPEVCARPQRRSAQNTVWSRTGSTMRPRAFCPARTRTRHRVRVRVAARPGAVGGIPPCDKAAATNATSRTRPPCSPFSAIPPPNRPSTCSRAPTR